MIYFFIEIFLYLIILLILFNYMNKKEITVLEIIILLFIFNIFQFSLYQGINILYSISIVLFIIFIYFIYSYIYNIKLMNTNDDFVLINRGIVNFKELVKCNYSYDQLINDLHKKGINNLNIVEYCLKRNNRLIILRKSKINNYPVSIIIDGIILKDNLLLINKNNNWLNNKINENCLKLSDINYAYYKNKKIYFITN